MFNSCHAVLCFNTTFFWGCNCTSTTQLKVYFIEIYFHKELFPTPGLGSIHMSDIWLDASSLLLRASATDLCHGNTLVIIIQTERSLFIAFSACSRHWCCPSVHSNKLNKWQWTDGPPWTSEKGYLHLWIFTISSLSLSADSLDKLTSDNNVQRSSLFACVCVHVCVCAALRDFLFLLLWSVPRFWSPKEHDIVIWAMFYLWTLPKQITAVLTNKDDCFRGHSLVLR